MTTCKVLNFKMAIREDLHGPKITSSPYQTSQPLDSTRFRAVNLSKLVKTDQNAKTCSIKLLSLVKRGFFPRRFQRNIELGTLCSHYLEVDMKCDRRETKCEEKSNFSSHVFRNRTINYAATNFQIFLLLGQVIKVTLSNGKTSFIFFLSSLYGTDRINLNHENAQIRTMKFLQIFPLYFLTKNFKKYRCSSEVNCVIRCSEN